MFPLMPKWGPGTVVLKPKPELKVLQIAGTYYYADHNHHLNFVSTNI